MKAFSLLLAAAIAALWAAAPAQAHPNHAAVSWKQMEPEVVAQFESDGELYSVTNTHQRGLFIGELIQIRDSHGALAHSVAPMRTSMKAIAPLRGQSAPRAR